MSENTTTLGFVLPKGCAIYISGPMTNMPNDNKEAFFAAQSFLENHGYKPINPHVLSAKLESELGRQPFYSEYLKQDFKALLDCQGIYVLAGWHRSPGALREIEVAKACAIPIVFEQGC